MSAASGWAGVLVGAERAAIPLDVLVELTHRCNFRCAHCYLTGSEQLRELTLPRLLRLVDELAELGTLRLGLSGGEPLLRTGWDAVARRARRLGFAVSVLTNGSCITPRVADVLGELDALVEVSVYAASSPVFDAVTATPGSYRRVRAGLELLRERGVRTVLKTPVMQANAHAIEPVVRLASELGAECVASPFLSPGRNGSAGPLALRLSDPALAAFLAGRERDTTPCPAVASADEPACAAGRRIAAVTAGGDVLACPDLPTPAGNLEDASFAEIWRSSPWLGALRRLRQADLPVCSHCPRLPSCGRCPALALAEDGDLFGPSRWSCRFAAALESDGAPL